MKMMNKYLELEKLLNNAYCAIDVVCNSCYYKDDYSDGDILNIARKNLEKMYDVLSKIEY